MADPSSEPAAANMLRIEHLVVLGSTVLTPVGEIDSLTTPLLRQAVTEAAAEDGTVVLDLGRVEFLGSVGLVVLVEASSGQLGPATLRIVPGSRRAVGRAISAAGLIEVLALYDTVEQALAASEAESA
ncbi:MAG TPA: anti-sigma factor antagonist [Pseudonocardia sp.]|jgi:anti-anti-sigma factor